MSSSLYLCLYLQDDEVEQLTLNFTGFSGNKTSNKSLTEFFLNNIMKDLDPNIHWVWLSLVYVLQLILDKYFYLSPL